MFPWQQQNAEPRFALLLTRLEDGINVDRSALRQAGLTRLHSVSHGEKALEIIRGQAGGDPALAVDLVICSGDLDDMSISAFMRALASLGSPLPVMVISGNDDELARAISQGSAATLRRPYSMNELARALETCTRKNAPRPRPSWKKPRRPRIRQSRARKTAQLRVAPPRPEEPQATSFCKPATALACCVRAKPSRPATSSPALCHLTPWILMRPWAFHAFTSKTAIWKKAIAGCIGPGTSACSRASRNAPKRFLRACRKSGRATMK